MKKIVLLVILGVLAWWYFDGSRRMSEEQIRAYYAEEVRIMTDLDKERLCLAMSDDYRLEDLSHTPQGPVRMALDKEQACTVAGAAIDMFSQLRAMSNGMLAPTIKHEIARIELSPDRKSATVETTSKILLGERLISRGRFSEKLIRRIGKIKSLGGSSESWSYGG